MLAAIIFEVAMQISLLAQARLPGGGSEMPLVTTNVERFVADPSAALVRAKILSSHWKPLDERTEAGVVSLKAVTVFRGPGIKAGDVVEIEGVRSSDPLGRQIDLRNPWNALPLAVNEELVLALHVGSTPRIFIPLAMSPFDGDEGGLSETVAIELLPVQQKLGRIQNALGSDSYLLRSYSLAALKNPGVATREQGAQAIVRAFEAAHLPDIRMMLFAEMESRNYFQEELGPDPANVVILSAWLRAILHETDEDRRNRFLTHLASTIGSKLADEPGKDRALREKFASAIQDPRRAEVGRVLRAEAAAHPGDSLFQNLAEAWAH